MYYRIHICILVNAPFRKRANALNAPFRKRANALCPGRGVEAAGVG